MIWHLTAGALECLLRGRVSACVPNMHICYLETAFLNKWIAGKKQCSVQEAVYWHNATPKDGIHGATAPTSALYQYKIQVKGVDRIPPLEPV